jgi:hypothetical protein
MASPAQEALPEVVDGEKPEQPAASPEHAMLV